MIKLKDVNLSFGDKKILNNLNINIKPGDKVLLNQKSGYGKTTLIKSLMGFNMLDSGEITVNHKIVNHSNIDKIRQEIFYLDQDITLPEQKTNELIFEILEYRGNKNKDINYDIDALLNEFHLNQDILNKNIKELSGGERQRVGLIIGIILNRPIWLLDEPTSALDKELKDVVKDRINKMDITALIISHDPCWTGLPTMAWRETSE